jgi:hypothetical protein
MKTRFALIALLLSGFACAQDKAPDRGAAAQPNAEAPQADPGSAANRKAYDALYSDILKTLPQEGRSKLDSARGRTARPQAAPAAVPLPSQEVSKEALERRKKDLEDLSPEVKARVDKALKDLEKRRKEKKAEFKELKE